MIKISLKEVEIQLKRIRLPQKEIEKILSILKEAKSRGLTAEQINIVVHNVVTKPQFRRDFFENPHGNIMKLIPGYRSDGELVQ